MKKMEVLSNFGSIKLIHKSGAELMIAHDGANNVFCVYLCSWSEIRGIKGLRQINTRFESGEGWRVMWRDCLSGYRNAHIFNLPDARIDICADADNDIYFIYWEN